MVYVHVRRKVPTVKTTKTIVKFPYTKAGEKKAKAYAKKTGGKVTMKKTTPKTKKGKAMVKKLGRTKKTGGFAKIAKKAAKEYGSKAAGKRVAGAIFWKMAKKGK